jgi:hypothetical protein
MPAILQDVPPGYDWGWYSREDPRMHLQAVDREHKALKYKVWLESRQRRVFEPATPIPAKVLKRLEAEVARRRGSIEAEWVHLMIEQKWLTYVLRGTAMTLIAYANTPNRFERTIELAPHLGIRAEEFKAQDVGLNSEYAVIELWPQKPISRRPFISIPELLWQD